MDTASESEFSFDEVTPPEEDSETKVGAEVVDAAAENITDHASAALSLDDQEEQCEDQAPESADDDAWNIPETEESEETEEDPPSDSAPNSLDGDAPVENVDTWGDVILQTRTKAFRVSSKLLSMASPVFEQMFSKDAIKDQKLKRHHYELRTFSLLEDDPEALSLICRLLHYCRDVIQASSDLDLLVKFVKLSEKYECIPVVRAQGIQWLRYRWKLLTEITKYPDGNDLRRALLVSHYLNDHELLQVITASIVGGLKMTDFLNGVMWAGSEDEELPALMKCKCGYEFIDSKFVPAYFMQGT